MRHKLADTIFIHVIITTKLCDDHGERRKKEQMESSDWEWCT